MKRHSSPLWNLVVVVAICSLLPLTGCSNPDENGAVSEAGETAAESDKTGAEEAAEEEEKEETGSDVPNGTEAEEATATPFFEEQLKPPTVRSLSATELAAGWISLFDGETMFGWENASDANFRVEQGAVVVDSGSKPGLLVTSVNFDNYVLKVDFLSDKETNSGIFLRTPPSPKNPATKCYELNIADTGTNPFPTASLVGRQKAEGEFDSLQWQTFEVTMLNDQVTIKLDGDVVSEYTDANPLGTGRIGLQFNQGKVAFANVFLQPLGLDPMLNGTDLTGWKEYPEMKSEFTVEEGGVLHVTNGKGQLETEKSYGDFVYQMECKVNAKGEENINSGIFFRCIPGDEMNGYESQIQNGFLDGDRTKPEDCGTGGIFRRVNARKIVADNNVWFQKTIIADGPNISVWVNGYQVTEFTDEREADPNPRRGLRLEPGTLIIQGHDPTTDFSFRNLKIRSLINR